MVKGIVISADSQIKPKSIAVTNLASIQAAVGGTFENIELEHPLHNMLVNEEGKITGLQVNVRATLMLWVHNSRFTFRDDIRGDVLLVGPTNRSGNYTDIPEEIWNLFYGRQVFDIEIVQDNDTRIVTIEHGINGWTEAYEAAVRLAEEYELKFKVRSA